MLGIFVTLVTPSGNSEIDQFDNPNQIQSWSEWMRE